MKAYTTIKAEVSAEFVEKRSRFIGSAKPVSDAEEAAEFVAGLKSKHYDAAHNCSAYILRSGAQRYSDDGEPQGTAGVPILEVLRRETIVDTIVVVTRYFGGILLGAGGLVRAYSHAAKLALNAAEKLVMQPCTLFSLNIPYPLYDKISLMFERYGIIVMETDFGEDISLRLRIPSTGAETFTLELTEITSGQVAPMFLGEVFA